MWAGLMIGEMEVVWHWMIGESWDSSSGNPTTLYRRLGRECSSAGSAEGSAHLADMSTSFRDEKAKSDALGPT